MHDKTMPKHLGMIIIIIIIIIIIMGVICGTPDDETSWECEKRRASQVRWSQIFLVETIDKVGSLQIINIEVSRRNHMLVTQ